MRQHASVYRRKGIWYVLSYSSTTEGVWIGQDPIAKISEVESAEEKGEVILRALAASRHDVPHPLDANVDTCSLRETIGAKSWNEFEKKVQKISIDRSETGFILIPWHRASKTGLVGVEDKEVVLPPKSPAAILGKAVEDAFAYC